MTENLLASGFSRDIWAFEASLSNESTIVKTGRPCVRGEQNLSFGRYDAKRDNLYFVHEVQEFEGTKNSGAISRWTVGRDNDGKLKLDKKETVLSLGASPCHLECDFDRGLLYVANYDGGSFAVYKLDLNSGAILGPEPIYREDYGKGSNAEPERQAEAHAHGVTLWKSYVYVVDLGADKIWHYKVEDHAVKKASPEFTEVPRGYGPRHMAVNGRYAYVVFELTSQVGIYEIDSANGGLKFLNSVRMMPQDNLDEVRQYGSEIVVHPNGKWLYVSNRGRGPLLVYDIDTANGQLKQTVAMDENGVWPRHFTLSPDGNHIVVADQFTNKLDVYTLDENGVPALKQSSISSENSPSYVQFIS